MTNFALQSRDKRSLVAVHFIYASSLIEILEQSTTIATGLLCILHKLFNVVIKEHDINIIYI